MTKKWILRKWGFYFCLRLRRQFGHTKLGDWRVFKFFLKKFNFKGVVEKWISCFLVYLILGFFTKMFNKMGVCVTDLKMYSNLHLCVFLLYC